MRREGDFFFFLRLTARILNFKVLYKGNNAFMSLSLYLFCLSLVNGLWCNVAVGHRGSGLFWTCRLSFGLLCYSLSAHESISSTEISFNLGVQKGCAARGALGGSTLRLFFFFFLVERKDEEFPHHEGRRQQGYRGRDHGAEKEPNDIHFARAGAVTIIITGFGQQGFGTWKLARCRSGVKQSVSVLVQLSLVTAYPTTAHTGQTQAHTGRTCGVHLTSFPSQSGFRLQSYRWSKR